MYGQVQVQPLHEESLLRALSISHVIICLTYHLFNLCGTPPLNLWPSLVSHNINPHSLLTLLTHCTPLLCFRRIHRVTWSKSRYFVQSVHLHPSTQPSSLPSQQWMKKSTTCQPNVETISIVPTTRQNRTSNPNFQIISSHYPMAQSNSSILSLSVVPSLISSYVVISNVSIKTVSKLSSKGLFHCGVFVTEPVRLEEITRQHFSAASDASNVSVVTIAGLQPLSRYSVVCYRSYMGQTSPLADALSTSRVVNTMCCRTIMATLSTLSFTVSPNAVKFLKLSFVSDPLTLIELNVTINSTFYSNENISPSIFSSKNMACGVTTLEAYIRPSFAGLFRYFVTVEGPSASNYTIQYSNGLNSFVVVPNDQQPAPPIINSVVFSDDASFLIISFDSPTIQPWCGPQSSCCDNSKQRKSKIILLLVIMYLSASFEYFNIHWRHVNCNLYHLHCNNFCFNDLS